MITQLFQRFVLRLLPTIFTVFLSISVASSIERPNSDGPDPQDAGESRLIPGDLLGKRIFEDSELSDPPGLSCASCHDAKLGYRGDNRSFIPGIPKGSRENVFGNRKTPSLAYMPYSPDFSFASLPNDVTGKVETVPVGGQFWDGRAIDLEQQVEGPLFNPREMNIPNKSAFIKRVQLSSYAVLAIKVYGANIFDEPRAFEKLASAVAGYEATPRFKPFSSKFDDWLEGRGKLTEQEYKGFQVFMDPNAVIVFHVMRAAKLPNTPKRPQIKSFRFHETQETGYSPILPMMSLVYPETLQYLRMEILRILTLVFASVST